MLKEDDSDWGGASYFRANYYPRAREGAEAGAVRCRNLGLTLLENKL